MRRKNLLTILLAVLCCSCCVFAACQKKVSFSFETNGGNSVAAIEAVKGKETSLPVPTRDGFEFEGWYLKADFSGSPVTSYKADGDVTFYAKWQQYATIKLDANGGSVSQTEIRGKVGEKVLDLVKSIVPTKTAGADDAAVRFSAWYNGSSALAGSTVLSSAGITLKAVYEYEYTLKVLVAASDGSGYVEDTEKSTTAYAPEGKLTAPSFTGLKLVSGGNATVTTKKATNVFELKYDREKFSVTFMPNYPGDEDGDSVSETVTYGEEAENGDHGFYYPGYLLAGWSTRKGGKIEYKTDLISGNVYNLADGGASRNNTDPIVPESDLTLYAVWTKGYVDMFGGSDVVFAFDGEGSQKTIYLYRGGKYFSGEYNVETNGFRFRNNAGGFSGFFITDDFFAYSDSSRVHTYKEYTTTFGTTVEFGINENTTISVDVSGRVTYTEKTESGETKTESKGVYVLNDGTYAITFDEGDLKGQTIHVILASTRGGDYVFQRRNDDEYGKTLDMFVLSGNILKLRTDGVGTLSFSGYNTVTMSLGTQSQGFYYNYNGEYVDLYSASMFGYTKSYSFKLIDSNGTSGYMIYNSSVDATYYDGVKSLTLDGVYGATYFDGNQTYNGVYATFSASITGGTPVRFFYADGSYELFLLKSEKTDNGTVNSFEPIFKGDAAGKYTFSEHYFVIGQTLVRTRVIVLNKNEAGEMIVYAMNKSKEYVVVASGKYEELSNGNYRFYDIAAVEASDLYEAEGLDIDNDFSDIESVEFALGTVSSNTYVYWVAETTKSGSTATDATIYRDRDADNASDELVIYGNTETTDDDGNKVVTLGFFATFTTKNSSGEKITVEGYIKDAGTFIYFVYNTNYALCFELDHETKTYLRYQSVPYSAYAVAENGTIDGTEFIRFDGKGNAEYVTVDSENKETVKPGDMNKTGETVAGGDVYTFNFTDGSEAFELIVFRVGSNYVFARKIEFSGKYENADGSTLELDGYVRATYTAANGSSALENVYYFKTDAEEGNVIMLLFGNSNGTYVFYFRLYEDRTFRMLGTEYGSFYLLDNQGMTGIRIELDGMGSAEDYLTVPHAKIIDYKRDANGNPVRNETTKQYEEIVVDGAAFYKIEKDADGRTFLYAVYKDLTGKVVSIKGTLTTATVNGSSVPVFLLIHEEVEETYVNEADWSVLIVNGYGVAAKIDGKTGVALTGNYQIITPSVDGEDGLLYFSATSGQQLYKYNGEKKTASYTTYKEQGYFSSDLSALFFNAYGFATYAKGNSSTGYYYDQDADGNVTLYHQDWTDPDHNEYGFVAELFGQHSETSVEFKDTVYYYAAGSTTVTFTKAEGKERLYPVPYDDFSNIYFGTISFAPTGKDTFSSTAKVVMLDEDGKEKDSVLSATVAREVIDAETNEKRTYILVSFNNGSAYEFDIKFSYAGANATNTYEITSMKWTIGGSAYNYNYQMTDLYMKWMQGQDVAALMEDAAKLNYGSMRFTRTFNSDGSILREFVTASFTQYTPLKDVIGGENKFWKLDGQTADWRYVDNGENREATWEAEADGFVSDKGLKVYLTAEDGTRYSATYSFRPMSYYQGSTFFLFNSISVVSEHTATDEATGKTYKARAERTIFTEIPSVKLGSLYSATLFEENADGEYVEIERTCFEAAKDENETALDSSAWYVSRKTTEATKEAKAKVTGSRIFLIAFGGGNVGTDGEYGAYETFTITAYDVKVAYEKLDNAEIESFVEYYETENGDKVVLAYSQSTTTVGFVKSSAYDKATDTCRTEDYKENVRNVKFNDDGTVSVSTGL